MAKKKVERKSKSFTEVFGLNKILSNETTDALFGLFLIASAIVLIIAMGSFSQQELLTKASWRTFDRENG